MRRGSEDGLESSSATSDRFDGLSSMESPSLKWHLKRAYLQSLSNTIYIRSRAHAYELLFTAVARQGVIGVETEVGERIRLRVLR